MRTRIVLMAVSLVLVAAGCRPGRDPVTTVVRTLTMARVGEQRALSESSVIVGRVRSDNLVLLLTDDPAVMRLDPERGTIVRREVAGLREGERPWGLARMGDGSLWTLLSARLVGRFGKEAQVIERIEETTSIGLYGYGHDLVLQLFGAEPGASALVHGLPGKDVRQPFGSLKIRNAGAGRAERAVTNLVGCGMTEAEELPCWFADDTTVDFVGTEGTGRPVVLAAAAGDIGATPALVEGRPHPIRDVYVDATPGFWTLWTDGRRTEGDGNLGWLLSRHTRSGDLLGAGRLPEPARLILGAEGDTCRLLTRSGRIVRVDLR